MRKKARACSTKVMCFQTIVLCTRPDAPGLAFCECAMTSAATTTARMPEPFSSSAMTYSRNGATSTSEFEATRSLLRRSTHASSHPPIPPTRTPATTATMKMPVTCSIVTLPAAAAARATLSAVSPVPSLTRLSPSRMETSLRGSPARRATALTATASVGDSTAPRAKAMARGMATTVTVTAPITRVDVMTSPMASASTGLLTLRRSR